MIEPKHLLQYVIRPVLKDLELWSVPAEHLLLGTACQESECGRWLHQLGSGPALGIYQMEPATYDDLWINFINHQPWRDKVAVYNSKRPISELAGNLYLATAMCRIHYLRVPEPIPDYLAGQAAYWKKYYNTEFGAGTTQEYMNAWNRFVAPGDLVV